jgi:hypothetical protein
VLLMPTGNAWAVPFPARHFPELFAALDASAPVTNRVGVAADAAVACPVFSRSSTVTSAESALPPFSVAMTHAVPTASGVTPPSGSTETSASPPPTLQV